MGRRVQRFEDLIAWQKGQDLAVMVYELMANCRDYGFKDQICKASVSVSNNISEGFERSTDNQFAQFLDYAKGSCGEVKSMTYLAKRLKIMTELQSTQLINLCDEESRIIYALMQAIKNTK